MSKFVLTGLLLATLLVVLNEPFTISPEDVDQYKRIHTPYQPSEIEIIHHEVATISTGMSNSNTNTILATRNHHFNE